MPTIDYEAEYDNRARVKDHPDIFARWDRDAAAYREAARDRGAEFGVPYGPSPRQFYDVFPALAGGRDAPIALFIHGGWWRSLDPRKFSHMAKGPNARGISVAVAGYDLCPDVSIRAIIDQMRGAVLALWRRFGRRLTVYGHSAGGHLAAAMLAEDWSRFGAGVPADLVPAAYAISGIFDLLPLLHVSQNADLRLTEASARDVSPVLWTQPGGRSFDVAVGREESSEFLRQSCIIAEAWGARGVATRLDIVPGNHFTVIDPLYDANSDMTARVASLAARNHAI